MLYPQLRTMNGCWPLPTNQAEPERGTHNPTHSRRKAHQPGSRTRHSAHLNRPRGGQATARDPTVRRRDHKLCTHVKAKTPLTKGDTVPEVGLQLNSRPCKHWEPAETYRISLDPDPLRPSPRRKVWTLSTLQIGHFKVSLHRPRPTFNGCSSSLCRQAIPDSNRKQRVDRRARPRSISPAYGAGPASTLLTAAEPSFSSLVSHSVATHMNDQKRPLMPPPSLHEPTDHGRPP